MRANVHEPSSREHQGLLQSPSPKRPGWKDMERLPDGLACVGALLKYVCLYICVCVSVCVYVCMHACMHVCMHGNVM